MSDCRQINDQLHIYILAGMATWPSFFQDFQADLHRCLADHGCEARIQILYPYGDFSRNMLTQIKEIRQDMNRFLSSFHIGGARAAAAIQTTGNPSIPLVLIGHSGGGIAGYHAALQLADSGFDVRRVFQIGTPKVPVAPGFEEKVGFLYAVNDVGKSSDPFIRFGSWGGWDRGGTLRWNRLKYSPRIIEPIPVIGWHMDYFRRGRTFMDASGRSNLDKTVAVVIKHLR